MVMNWKGTHFF